MRSNWLFTQVLVIPSGCLIIGGTDSLDDFSATVGFIIKPLEVLCVTVVGQAPQVFVARLTRAGKLVGLVVNIKLLSMV